MFYDKSYHTHEPLAGLPEVEFEEKPMDLDSEYDAMSQSSPEMRRDADGRVYDTRDSVTNGPIYTAPMHRPAPQPPVPSYAANTYAEPFAHVNRGNQPRDTRDTFQSQASIVTDV